MTVCGLGERFSICRKAPFAKLPVLRPDLPRAPEAGRAVSAVKAVRLLRTSGFPTERFVGEEKEESCIKGGRRIADLWYSDEQVCGPNSARSRPPKSNQHDEEN